MRNHSVDTLRHSGGIPAAALAVIVSLFLVAGSPTNSSAVPCEVPDDGTGTVSLPPLGCGYVSPADLHIMIDGLPPGTTIEVSAEHAEFFNVVQTPGGSLGGEIELFDSILVLQMTGTGALAGFARTIAMPANCEVHTGPRNPGDPVQTFPNEMFALQGEIFGDPDFVELRILAGSGFGLPSPGQTTLTDLGNGNWNVDSFFDITYQIDFVGAPGSALEGMGGSTTGVVTMLTGEPIANPNPCVVADNGTGTVTLPPADCDYLSPEEVHLIIDGLPPGTTIELDPIHSRFINDTQTPGGPLGGEIEEFDSFLSLDVQGTGELSTFQRNLSIPVHCLVASGPRNPGDPVQEFPTEMLQLQGGIFGDPDFDFLQVVAGSDFGLPSPGQTTLTDLGNGNWQVDSFFDITYQIDFQGAPGSILEGLAGSTTATLRMSTGSPLTSSLPENDVLADRTKLDSHPNPFSPNSTITFALQQAAKVEIRVYDVSGRMVRSLVGQELEAGEQQIEWDGRDASDREVESGTYFYHLIVDGRVIDREKALKLK